ncbi:hypothetical protein ACPV5V_32610, partial [Vibrio campbellii]
AVAAALSLNEVADEELQDMSDPLAVYTLAGIGFTDKGLNLKVGTDGKRRVWRKLHLAVETITHEIVAVALSLSKVTDEE